MASTKLPRALTKSDDPSVAEFLTILDKHRQHCEDNGLYIEAEVTKKRIAELRGHEEQRKKEAIAARHIAEKLTIEVAHMTEWEEYNVAWDQKLAEFEEKAAALEREMQEQHAKKLLDWQEAQAKKTFKPKYSRDLMQLRQTEKTFAKNMNYMDAQRVKLNADAREKFEFEEAKKEWLSKLFSKQNLVTKQFDAELEMCRHRIAVGREQQRRTRQAELDRLLQRYQNIKTGVETQQNIEKVKMADYGLPSGVLPAKNASAATTAAFFTSPSTSITPAAPQHLVTTSSGLSPSIATKALPLPLPHTQSNQPIASASTTAAAAFGMSGDQKQRMTTTAGSDTAKGGAAAAASTRNDWKSQTTPVPGKAASPKKQPVHPATSRTKAPTNTGRLSSTNGSLSARKPAASSSGTAAAPASTGKRAGNRF